MNLTPGQAPAPHKPRVAVVFGGRSSEHAVSCMTAAGVLRALDRDRYDVVPVGIATDGRWVLAEDDPDVLEARDRTLPAVDTSGPGVLVPTSTSDRTLRALRPGEVPSTLGNVDVVFPLLHGPFGEDGTLQGLLELGDVPYVGSGVLASAASMDKHYMKVLLAGHGLPVGPYEVVTPRQWETDPDAVLARLAALALPVFVKPARAGSSMGITRVEDPADLRAAIEAAREHDPKVVVEAGIAGRELECGVLQDLDGTPRASELGEIEVVSGHSFYDFEAKYLDEDDVRLTTPADVPPDVRDRVQELAVETFEVMGCEGLARVDVFLTPDGEVVVNEINTMPGFTPISMFPRMWAASGVDYPALVDRLIQLALRRRTGLR
ncbi:D-alanine--D-alanine ligase family protein [Angustibacter sp. Root456]|uniref:D-alanine--D-alanine ligase family protein n=1 Tax=Angustibacter sp. Root456 TaxID=1736539 RepID=UPI0006F39213|nr:D-alanine--D-alanine ligase family protein [Angustibacter sp. Root456]KQX69576.1 D-alanine--D-alanine ligase [Angustibacter sp. Root456]